MCTRVHCFIVYDNRGTARSTVKTNKRLRGSVKGTTAAQKRGCERNGLAWRVSLRRDIAAGFYFSEIQLYREIAREDGWTGRKTGLWKICYISFVFFTKTRVTRTPAMGKCRAIKKLSLSNVRWMDNIDQCLKERIITMYFSESFPHGRSKSALL